jgi:hypothetical protein
MIHHQNADAMGLVSALMRGITPLDVSHFEYYQGVNASPTRTGCQHFDDELWLCQNHWKIIGKTKKSGFCIVYSVLICFTSQNCQV